MAGSRWKDSRRGFSLLELMVALAIFATSIGVLLSAQTAAARHQQRARNLFTAVALQRDLLADIEVTGVPPIGEEEGDFGEEFPGYTWRRIVTESNLEADISQMAGALGLTMGNIPVAVQGLNEVLLVVEWEERGSTRSAQIIYYVVSGVQ